MESLAKLARHLFTQALADCSIDRAMERLLRVAVDADGAADLILSGEHVLDLNRVKRVRILAAGKAAATMVNALLPRLPLPTACDLQGMLIAPERPQHLAAAIQFFPGGHPTPNAASFAGAATALAALRSLSDANPDDTLCIFLLSGGASSMMELPLDPVISLEDTIAFHRALVHSGASIVEINCVRKHFSAVKGGRLALAAGAATKVSLLVSDVPSANLDALASGPTLPDPTTVAQCLQILATYSLLEQFPLAVRQFFESPQLPETPKASELTSRAYKLLGSEDLAEAVLPHAAALGFHAVIDNTCDDWPCMAAADYLLNRLRDLRRDHPRVCLLSAGEVTVQLPANHSVPAIGGRNQHLALYLATQLRPSDGPIAILSAGSDGIDGNSLAAGGVVEELSIGSDSRRAGALHALETFDSSTWLAEIGATVVTGPTGHNLRDLRILLAGAPPSIG